MSHHWKWKTPEADPTTDDIRAVRALKTHLEGLTEEWMPTTADEALTRPYRGITGEGFPVTLVDAAAAIVVIDRWLAYWDRG
jgi:hypothetical protein